jgi:predicted flap endonuclease-1-like 5' DNA nuclease
MSPKYKKNPARGPGNISINGVKFDDNTVVQGEQWEKYSRPMFEGKPAPLVRIASEVEPTIKTEQKDPTVDKQAAKPHVGPSQVITMAAMTVDKAKEQEKQKAKDKVAKKAPEPPKEEKPKAPKPPVKIMAPVVEDDDTEWVDWELTDISGVGPARAEVLDEAGYDTVEAIAEADPKDVQDAVKGVDGKMNLATARSIVKSAKELLENE